MIRKKIKIENEADLINFELRNAMHDVKYHEECLIRSHREIAAAKALYSRGNYSDAFTIDEARKFNEEDADYFDPLDMVKLLIAAAFNAVEYHECALRGQKTNWLY